MTEQRQTGLPELWTALDDLARAEERLEELPLDPAVWREYYAEHDLAVQRVLRIWQQHRDLLTQVAIIVAPRPIGEGERNGRAT